MIRDITIGQYYPTESVIHDLDPRTKLFGTMGFIISLFFVNNLYTYGVILVAFLITVRLSKVPLKYMTKGLKTIVFIIAFAFLLNIFMTNGRIIFQIGPLKATWEGLYIAVLMASRLILLIVGSSLLTLTTSPIQLSDGLEKIMRPLEKIGVKTHEFAMMMTIALRFIPTLLEETDKIMKAQMARGADFETGSIMKRAKSLIPLLVPLFVSAFRRATDLAMAMEARCYRGGVNRTKLKNLEYTRWDRISYAVIFLYVALVYCADFAIGKVI